MKYLDKENNPVEPEKWCWVVLYSDKTALEQFDMLNEKYHYFAEIDQSRVEAFGLVSIRTDGVKQLFKPIPNGAKLIHYYDNIIQQPLGGTAIHHRLYCFGYELGKEKHIWTVLPTDVVVEGKINNIEII